MGTGYPVYLYPRRMEGRYIMAYTPNSWAARSVQYPNRFQTAGGDYMTLTPAPGTIAAEGTPFSADWMNHIEQGIAALSVDSIVEEGTSGFWQYIKLENGLIFLFTMNLGITMPAWESLASLYWRTVEVTVPEVVSTLYASFGDTSTDYARWTRCNGNWGGTTIKVQQYSMNTNGDAAYTRLQGFVVGTWKE